MLFLSELMYASKAGFVPAMPFPPAIDNSLVVPEDLEVLFIWSRYKVARHSDKEFEANCFCLPNVLLIFFPPGNEFPCPPPVSDEDANTNTRAGI